MSVALDEGTRLRSGRYELDREIGRGAHATVWCATDTVLERRVAVKVLAEGLLDDREWLARFRREAQLAARLQHPNLVSVYDFSSEAERPYLVMAYLPGGSLQARLDAGGRPQPKRIACDLLAALAHIHGAGIVHRDVKPGNVLFDRDGRACLTDFGVARPQDATSITQVGQMPGTARYMAPELWQGEPASERSDLYSLGVLLAALPGAVEEPRLDRLIARLTSADPRARPESAGEALTELGEAADPVLSAITSEVAAVPADFATPPEAQPAAGDPLPERPRDEPASVAAPAPRPRRARWLPAAALGVVALFAGFLIAGGFGGGEDDPASNQQRAERSGGGGEGDGGSDEQSAQEAGRADGGSGGVPVDPARGAALNEKGFALIQNDQAAQAIGVLERAVASFPEGSEDLNYAYALYNLGNAYRLAGRPDDAIPVLEERLQIPNQTETVQAELDRARQEAAG